LKAGKKRDGARVGYGKKGRNMGGDERWTAKYNMKIRAFICALIHLGPMTWQRRAWKKNRGVERTKGGN